ncbi:hypothetical protein BDA99DRAFT_493496 [Phascolomyces articulosus]|uniref:PH domain-containing protein n=1 Tax=Phascolomyces articulosus TaxID=60185 RepID=A0AAD5KRT1_9FUNG|nr:hypothetical protein BDA99DRAFT_493496 [Phascolomyces articulosus]
MTTLSQQKTEPVSILKSSSQSKNPSEHMGKTTRIVLSEDDEDDDYAPDSFNKYLSDGEDDDPAAIPISGQALELLQTEKSVKSGYLLKKGEKRRTWKKRWFVLRTTKLAMYKDSKEYKLLRIIDLHEIHSVVHVTSRNKYKYMFAISTPKRMYYLQADNQHELDGWIAAIEQMKSELAMYDADDDDASSVGRDQAFAKGVVSSYKSHHSTTSTNVAATVGATMTAASNSAKQTSQQPVSPTFSQQRRRQSSGSGGSAIGSFQLDRRPSAGIATSSSHVHPVDIPQSSSSSHHPHHRPEPFQLNTSNLATSASSSIEQQQQHHGLGSYVTGQTYPLSPISDHQAQLHVADALASSEDDDEYSWTDDMANVQQEENRNRVLIDGYLLKLGRNKGWRKRWFVLRTDTLAYYEDDKEYAPHKIIPLTHIIDSLEIEPISKNKKYCFKIVIPKRSYILCASSEMELESWLNALSVGVRRAKKNDLTGSGGTTAMTSPTSTSTTHTVPSILTSSTLPQSQPPVTSPTTITSSTQQQQQQQHHLQKLATGSSFDSFENSSHISGVSGAGAIGGAGGALPGRAHTHTHKLGRAK